jgi:hypothetical protein
VLNAANGASSWSANDVLNDSPQIAVAVIRALAKAKGKQIKVEVCYPYEGCHTFYEDAVLVDDILCIANEIENLGVS